LESRAPKNSLIRRVLEDMPSIMADNLREEMLEVYRAAFAHPSPAVRDAAALGLLELGSRAARALLEHQSALENNRNVRKSLTQVLASFRPNVA
jgi:vesicle coat complex subunit